jgi:hypothetical protein
LKAEGKSRSKDTIRDVSVKRVYGYWLLVLKATSNKQQVTVMKFRKAGTKVLQA